MRLFKIGFQHLGMPNKKTNYCAVSAIMDGGYTTTYFPEERCMLFIVNILATGPRSCEYTLLPLQ